MQPVATYYGTKKIYEKIEGMEIQWPERDTAPPDIPFCGFDGTALHCQPDGNYFLTIMTKFFKLFFTSTNMPIRQSRSNLEGFPIIKTILFFLISVMIIGTSIAYFVYKHMRLEASLADCWWRINFDDLEFLDEKGQAGKKSTLSLASEASFMSN